MYIEWMKKKIVFSSNEWMNNIKDVLVTKYLLEFYKMKGNNLF